MSEPTYTRARLLAAAHTRSPSLGFAVKLLLDWMDAA